MTFNNFITPAQLLTLEQTQSLPFFNKKTTIVQL